MTQLLYQTDSYLQEFDASIVSVLTHEHAIVLDQTAFYPGGGGQPCDFGSFAFLGCCSLLILSQRRPQNPAHHHRHRHRHRGLRCQSFGQR